MRTCIPFVGSLLLLAVVAAACTLLGHQPARGGGVYLVGVAGGG